VRYNKPVSQILLSLFIFTIPLNLFLKLSLGSAYVDGLLIDYLIPKLYLSDIVLWILLLNWLRLGLQKKSFNLKKITALLKKQRWGIIFISLLVMRQAFGSYAWNGFWFALQITESGLLLWFLFKNSNLLKTLITRMSVLITLAFQFLLALYQFMAQQPLLPYQFFGEPRFAPYYQLSRHIFFGQEKILPYAATAHPNVLAGLGVMFCLIIWSSNWLKLTKVQRRVLKSLSLILCLALVILTQSLSALLTLGLGLILSHFSLNLKILKASLLIILILSPITIHFAQPLFIKNPSVQRRAILNQAAITLFVKKPVSGVGLNQFNTQLSTVAHYQDLRNFIQPAHHVPLLWLAETGLLGISIVIWIWRQIKKQDKKKIVQALLIISPILALDHYLYSLQSGRLILILWLGWFLTNLNQFPQVQKSQ
jgi:hypothetical protein